MSEKFITGKFKIPEEEKKFGLSLIAELAFSADEPVNVAIFGAEDLDNDRLFEVVSATFHGDSLHRILETMLAATVSPPDVHSQLVQIATNDEVVAISLDEPMMPPTIPISYFR